MSHQLEFLPIATGLYLEALCIGSNEVWFSDVMQGGVHRVAPDGTIHTWMADRRWIGSLLLNTDGAVLCSGLAGIAWFHPSTGASGMLLDEIDGKPLLGVNEIMPDGKGGIYFATLDIPSIVQRRALEPAALYRLAADGRVTKVAEGLLFPNGIGLSPDGTRLYHNDTRVGTFAFDVRPDGSLGDRTLLLEKTDCDGLAVDAQGNIWVTGYRSPELLCLRPDGAVDKRVALPGDGATNVRFGGEDGRDLYVTTVPLEVVEGFAQGVLPSVPKSVLYRARSDVRGRPLARTDFSLT